MFLIVSGWIVLQVELWETKVSCVCRSWSIYNCFLQQQEKVPDFDEITFSLTRKTFRSETAIIFSDEIVLQKYPA